MKPVFLQIVNQLAGESLTWSTSFGPQHILNTIIPFCQQEQCSHTGGWYFCGVNVTLNCNRIHGNMALSVIGLISSLICWKWKETGISIFPLLDYLHWVAILETCTQASCDAWARTVIYLVIELLGKEVAEWNLSNYTRTRGRSYQFWGTLVRFRGICQSNVYPSLPRYFTLTFALLLSLG